MILPDIRGGEQLAPPLPAWVRSAPCGTVFGSLFAVPERERREAAGRFAAHGLPMHLDVILSRDGDGALIHSGITRAEMVDFRECAAGARIEVHVIVLEARVRDNESGAESADGEVRDEIAAVLRVAQSIGAERAALPERYAADADLTAAFRGAGGEIWTVLAPGPESDLPDPAHHPHGATISGVLVMLIPPGTRQAARPELLERVARLAPVTRVAVDGGVDPDLAARAFALGAHHVVVGRALLGPASPEQVGEHP